MAVRALVNYSGGILRYPFESKSNFMQITAATTSFIACHLFSSPFSVSLITGSLVFLTLKNRNLTVENNQLSNKLKRKKFLSRHRNDFYSNLGIKKFYKGMKTILQNETGDVSQFFSASDKHDFETIFGVNMDAFEIFLKQNPLYEDRVRYLIAVFPKALTYYFIHGAPPEPEGSKELGVTEKMELTLAS